MPGTTGTPAVLYEDGRYGSGVAASDADFAKLYGPSDRAGLQRNVYTEPPDTAILAGSTPPQPAAAPLGGTQPSGSGPNDGKSPLDALKQLEGVLRRGNR